MKFCKICNVETERNSRGSCKPCARRRNTAWRNANIEKARESEAKWRAANPEKQKAAQERWNAANPESNIKACRKWYQENKEHAKAKSNNKRVKKLANGGRLSKDLASKLFRLQKGKCACCGLPLDDDYHLDHIMPIALGGPNTDSNIQLLRKKCNLSKSAKHPVDFMQQRGFLL